MASSAAEAKSHHRRLDDTYVGIIIGALAAFIFLIMVVSLVVICQYRRYKFSRNSSPSKSMFAVDHVSFNMSDLTPTLPNGKLSNGLMYNVVVNPRDAGVEESEVDTTRRKAIGKSAPRPSTKIDSSDPRDSGARWRLLSCQFPFRLVVFASSKLGLCCMFCLAYI